LWRNRTGRITPAQSGDLLVDEEEYYVFTEFQRKKMNLAAGTSVNILKIRWNNDFAGIEMRKPLIGELK